MPDLSELRQQITKHFNKSELRALCFDLRIDYESLSEEGKADHVTQLLAYVKRHNLFPDLITTLKKHKPKIDWDTLRPL